MMTSAAALRRLQIEPALASKYPAHPFVIGHQLALHPLFALPRLIELATTLPPHCVEYNSGNIPVNMDPAQTPRTGLSVVETIRRIEDCGSWMVLKYASQDPEYRAILEECLEEVQDSFGGITSGMFQKECFLFISSPSSVTPYHMDREHNFLLQIRGSKQVSLFDPEDRTILSEAEIEQQLHGSRHRNMIFKEFYQSRASVFTLGPGMGLHFPVAAPHWVKNGGEVSISFSVTYRSTQSENKAILYFTNGLLRKSGVNPSPPGRHPGRDRLKLLAFRAAKKVFGVRRAFRR